MMKLFLAVLLKILLFTVETTGSFFNTDELTNALYDVDILGEPKLFSERSDSATSMMLLSKHGQRYECILPTNVHTTGIQTPSGEPSESKAKAADEEGKKAKSSLTNIPRLLDGMADGNCLRLSKGWWEYEFCFRKRIRQYHRNEQTGAIESESVLGEFASDYDWTDADVTNAEAAGASSGSRSGSPRSHSQSYDRGSVCDLTGSPRRADVIFQCDLAPHAADMLVDVEEPASCIYRLLVKTPRLCDSPLLRRAAEDQIPSRRRPPETIQCRPLLPPESMQRYKQAQEAKRLAAKRKAEAEHLQMIYRDNPLRREARIRHVLAGRLGGPLRRQKLLEMSNRRHRRLRHRLAVAEKAADVASNVLDSARRLSTNTEASLKAITKRLKAKFKSIEEFRKGMDNVKKMDQGTVEKSKSAHTSEAEKKDKTSSRSEDDENAEAIRSTMSTLPEEVRRRLTSSDGLATLRTGLGAQFQQILEAARQEVGQGADNGQPDIVNRMSDMLDKILSQVDAAGQRLDKESKLLDSAVNGLRKSRQAANDKTADPGSQTSTVSKGHDKTQPRGPPGDEVTGQQRPLKKEKSRKKRMTPLFPAAGEEKRSDAVDGGPKMKRQEAPSDVTDASKAVKRQEAPSDVTDAYKAMKGQEAPSDVTDASKAVKGQEAPSDVADGAATEGRKGPLDAAEGAKLKLSETPTDDSKAKGREAPSDVTDSSKAVKGREAPSGVADSAKGKPEEARSDVRGGAKARELSTQMVEQLRRVAVELRRMERRGVEPTNMMVHVMTLGSDRNAGDGDGTGGQKEQPFVGIFIWKNDQQQREQERMRRLEENYNFRVDDLPPL